MTKRHKPRGRRGVEGSTDIEWVGGTISMPTYVTGEGEPYRPEVLLWMGADGVILGSTLARPGELLGMASGSLETAIEQPMCGLPHAPTRVRVASSDLADVLRAGHPAVEVVCAPTPELDGVLALMREEMGEGGAVEQSYLSPEVGPDAVASFFRAAAGLFRAKPWKVVPSDQDLFSVSIEQLGLRDAAMSIIGQMGQSRGVILFADLDDVEAFVDAANAIESGEELEMPPHVSLNFERGADLGDELRREVAEHHWEVAAANAYPWLVAMDEERVVRPPTAREVTVGETLALALSTVLTEKKALRAAWGGGEPVSRTLCIRTHAGEIGVTLRAPYERVSGPYRPVHDLLAGLFDLAQAEDMIDPEERGPLEDELLCRFEASPEARGVSDVQACRFVMDFAADYFGETVVTLGPSELREIIFQIIPRKVGIDASEARWIIEDNRAFYAFLKRECDLAEADACLRVLGGNAVKKLEAALSDSRNFGMAKSVILAGRDAGFDVDTEEGLEAWMRVAQGMPVPPSVGGPAPAGPSPHAVEGARQAKKKKRKASRKARRRNR